MWRLRRGRARSPRMPSGPPCGPPPRINRLIPTYRPWGDRIQSAGPPSGPPPGITPPPRENQLITTYRPWGYRLQSAGPPGGPPPALIACVLSRTGPLFSTVIVQMGKVPDSPDFPPVRSHNDQRPVREPCAHLGTYTVCIREAPGGILEAHRGTRQDASWSYPGVT